MNEAKARYKALKADPNVDSVALKAAKKQYKALKNARESTTSTVGAKRPRTTISSSSGGKETKDTNKTSEAKVTTTNTTINETSSKKTQKKSKKSKKSKKKKKQKNHEAEEDDDEAADDAAEQALLAAHSGSSSTTSSSSSSTSTATTTTTKPSPDQTTIILFYAYVDPQFTRHEQDECMEYCTQVLSSNGMTGRLRIGREGFNGTLTGPYDGARAFVAALRSKWPKTFSNDEGNKGDCCNNFKFVDGLPANQRLKALKVFPVTEIVTYGFDPKQAPLHMRGKHLSPQEFHNALEGKNTICLDVRNFNESLIGKFVPPGDIPVTGAPGVVTDMLMRRSTDFPKWVDNNRHRIDGKKVLLYCTAGVRCERASAFLRNRGVDDVYQLDGGVHRYLEHFKEGGGHWKGKNYTFDKRYAHGADNAEIISNCVHCDAPWERYQASAKCAKCKMEVLLCRRCQRTPKPPKKSKLHCPLCKPGGNRAGLQPLPETDERPKKRSKQKH